MAVVVCATGLSAGDVVTEPVAAGEPVRALTRDPERRDGLERLGVQALAVTGPVTLAGGDVRGQRRLPRHAYRHIAEVRTPEAVVFAGRKVSAASAVEVGIVVEAKQGAEATEDLQRLLALIGVITVPFDAEQAIAAVAAWRRIGRGRHPAALDLGDCFSYALAKTSGAAVLHKGDDFSQTDITSALG